jgi:hypothetical protein
MWNGEITFTSDEEEKKYICDSITDSIFIRVGSM